MCPENIYKQTKLCKILKLKHMSPTLSTCMYDDEYDDAVVSAQNRHLR